MKTAIALPLLLAAGLTWTTALHAQDNQVKENVKTFMRAKLKHAQMALEGLTLEDFDAIARSAQEMSLLSMAEQWQVFQTPEYIRRSADFRRAADALMESAKARNLDGATLNYVKMTINCVECHKYVRTTAQARQGGGDQTNGLALRAP